MKQFSISVSSGIPIYKQLCTQIERMILTGIFTQGEILPSVRQVASELEVNPMTVSKAYGLLEERGVLTRLRGKGMAVAKKEQKKSNQERLSVITEMIDELLKEAALMGLSNSELTALFKEKIITERNQSEIKE
ncbi:GntR family transcriptional regulator [Colwellia sp. RSH04]|uniref:GntR family transcriptional regulator n=1 Tax=Colwellia sp. RSH04 TaxID=2305464 RepID=UPI000E57C1E7|nr:GntR family transcriptional regulator [Colwellia sp. RSH04]RHW75203.1 GntR family transcriptional regulator [Colwellia sp. RSH04]